MTAFSLLRSSLCCIRSPGASPARQAETVSISTVSRFRKEPMMHRTITDLPSRNRVSIKRRDDTAAIEPLEGRLLLSAAKPQILSDLPAVAQQSISASIGRDQPAYHATAAGSGVALFNPANAFTAQVRAGTLAISAGSSTWGMSLAGWGYGGVSHPLGSAATTTSSNRVDANYGAVDEWFVNGPMGLEQG